MGNIIIKGKQSRNILVNPVQNLTICQITAEECPCIDGYYKQGKE